MLVPLLQKHKTFFLVILGGDLVNLFSTLHIFVDSKYERQLLIIFFFYYYYLI